MRILFLIAIGLIQAGVLSTDSFGQTAAPSATSAPGGRSVQAGPRFTFILFWKQQDASTQQFGEALRTAASKRAELATWSSIDIGDPANRAAVEHYGVSRAPMPLGVCVADNGAVTGVFMRRPTDEAIERAMVTPAMAQVTKGLQDKKIVVVHVQPTAESPLPSGAAEFAADPDFRARTVIVPVALGDPEESRFVADMELSAGAVGNSLLVVMAPPGVLVGKFSDAVTKDEISTALHAAGKCCNDPNCKHNRRAK